MKKNLFNRFADDELTLDECFEKLYKIGLNNTYQDQNSRKSYDYYFQYLLKNGYVLNPNVGQIIRVNKNTSGYNIEFKKDSLWKILDDKVVVEGQDDLMLFCRVCSVKNRRNKKLILEKDFSMKFSIHEKINLRTMYFL